MSSSYLAASQRSGAPYAHVDGVQLGETAATKAQRYIIDIQGDTANESGAVANMKFLPLRDLDSINNALNFSTAEYHVIGGCDVYTTKAAGRDKKLYKKIDKDLEEQYETLEELSASLSPPATTATGALGDGRARRASVGARDIFANHNSPFGPLTENASRRTFAYLITTLNASHPDYDFRWILVPTDFKKVRRLNDVKQHVDGTLIPLRPAAVDYPDGSEVVSPPKRYTFGASRGAPGPEIWSPKMWDLIDKQMDLKFCKIYTYEAQHDPFDNDEGCIWSFKYLFYNKIRRRVCYLYAHGISVLSHSPLAFPAPLDDIRNDLADGLLDLEDDTADEDSQRAQRMRGVSEELAEMMEL